MKEKRLRQIMKNDNAKLRKGEAKKMAASLILFYEIDRTVTFGKVQELERKLELSKDREKSLHKERDAALTRAYAAEGAAGRAWDERETFRRERDLAVRQLLQTDKARRRHARLEAIAGGDSA